MLTQENMIFSQFAQASRLSFGEVLPEKEEPQGDTAHRTPLVRVGREEMARDEDSPGTFLYFGRENWRSQLSLSFPGNGTLVDAWLRATSRSTTPVMPKTPCFIATDSSARPDTLPRTHIPAVAVHIPSWSWVTSSGS